MLLKDINKIHILYSLKDIYAIVGSRNLLQQDSFREILLRLRKLTVNVLQRFTEEYFRNKLRTSPSDVAMNQVKLRRFSFLKRTLPPHQ